MSFKIWSPFVEEINTPEKAIYANLDSASDEFETFVGLSHTDIVRVRSVDGDGNITGDVDVTVPVMWVGIVN